MEQQDALQAVSDAVTVWEVDPVGALDDLRRSAATWSTVSGSSVAAELAADDDETSRARIRTLALELRDELGLPQREGADLQDAAVAAMCRRHLAGGLTARELTYWIWRVVGLKGSERCRPFLKFEDEYTRYAAYDCSAIDADVTTTAGDFVKPREEKRRSGLAKFFRRR